jgi:N-acylneuraminate cytidylyltransferase
MSQSKTNIVAIVPARGGSKGVPGKNLRLLRGHPLIAYSIVAARLANNVDRVIVSTDSEAIAETSVKYGAEVPFLRPAAFAQDTSPDRDFLMHALEWFDGQGTPPEYIVHLRPTTPLRDPREIDRAIDALRAKATATSLRSAHAAPESPFKWFRIETDGFYGPILDTMKLDDTNKPRQAFPPVYVPNGYVDVLRVAHLRRSPNIHGDRILPFVTAVATEVDTPDDLVFLEHAALGTLGDALVRHLDRLTTKAAAAEPIRSPQ